MPFWIYKTIPKDLIRTNPPDGGNRTLNSLTRGGGASPAGPSHGEIEDGTEELSKLIRFGRIGKPSCNLIGTGMRAGLFLRILPLLRPPTLANIRGTGPAIHDLTEAHELEFKFLPPSSEPRA